MIPLSSQTGIRLRAALAMLLLLVGAIAPSARLWLPEPVTCGMACCEASGVCYCQKRHKGESGATGAAALADVHAARRNAAGISASCPAKCAQLPAGFQTRISIAKARISECVLYINLTQLLYARAPRFARNALPDASSAPRAPPSTLLRINSFIIQ
jgi:hypothetical protein